MGRVFKGYRISPNGKKLIPLLFRVQEGSDTRFFGRAESPYVYRGHPVHELAGGCEGTWFSTQIGKLVEVGNRSDRPWTFKGIVFRQSIIGQYARRNEKGKTERPQPAQEVVAFGGK